MIKISKVLSANDLGLTGSHQSGMLVPKRPEILGFFPYLDAEEKNPRCRVMFRDGKGDEWKFNYIYYNNALFGGTRNEYRLTGMTRFFREFSPKPGDSLILSKSEESYQIDISKTSNKEEESFKLVIRQTSSWKVVRI